MLNNMLLVALSVVLVGCSNPNTTIYIPVGRNGIPLVKETE